VNSRPGTVDDNPWQKELAQLLSLTMAGDGVEWQAVWKQGGGSFKASPSIQMEGWVFEPP